jgi:uncharacterized protein YceK
MPKNLLRILLIAVPFSGCASVHSQTDRAPAGGGYYGRSDSLDQISDDQLPVRLVLEPDDVPVAVYLVPATRWSRAECQPGVKIGECERLRGRSSDARLTRQRQHHVWTTRERLVVVQVCKDKVARVDQIDTSAGTNHVYVGCT